MNGRYLKLINLPYPDPDRELPSDILRKYPRQDLIERSKIFAPFAAVRSHEKAINMVQKKYYEKDELSEYSLSLLGKALDDIQEKLENGEKALIEIRYFQAADTVTADYAEEGIADITEGGKLGLYISEQWYVRRLILFDILNKRLILEKDDIIKEISLDDVSNISIIDEKN